MLEHDQRRVRRKVLTLVHGDQVLLDFPQPLTLGDRDRLMLEDGRSVEVIAAEEPLYAVTAATAPELVRLAWHLGNRHLPAQLNADRILIRRDPVIRTMLLGLGAGVAEVSEPFRAGTWGLSRPRRGSRAAQPQVTGASAQQRLLTWLSPAFPTGGFAYSAGLETAIATGTITNAATAEGLDRWGAAARRDAQPMRWSAAAAHRAFDDAEALRGCADLVLALTVSPERREELLATGDAFIAAVAAWPATAGASLPTPCPYPVAVAATAAAHGIEREATVLALLTATVAAQVSVAVRLVPIGQTAGSPLSRRWNPLSLPLAGWAGAAGLEDLGSIGYAADIAQMQHQLLPTRIFRS